MLVMLRLRLKTSVSFTTFRGRSDTSDDSVNQRDPELNPTNRYLILLSDLKNSKEILNKLFRFPILDSEMNMSGTNVNGFESSAWHVTP